MLLSREHNEGFFYPLLVPLWKLSDRVWLVHFQFCPLLRLVLQTCSVPHLQPPLIPSLLMLQPGGAQVQAECSSWQPDLVGCVPAHGRGLELNHLWGSFRAKPFHASTIWCCLVSWTLWEMGSPSLGCAKRTLLVPWHHSHVKPEVSYGHGDPVIKSLSCLRDLDKSYF